MSTSFANAIAAYNDAARALGGRGLETRPAPDGAGFAAMLRDAATEAVKVGRAGEEMSLQAVAGQADLTDVVTAVSNAEVTLQTVVAVRDRVIQAYQDILRMPI